MNRHLTVLALFLLVKVQIASCQDIFWSEDFGTGCNQGQLATSYGSPNGAWTFVSTGTNAGSANTWYVSAAENGNAVGICGSGCGSDRTLHIGSVSVLFAPADPGAAYYEGFNGLCGFLPCGATSKRMQSPTIDCTGKSNIQLDFVYIEGGNAIDNATLWYNDGSTWVQLSDPAKTFSDSCSPQGLWTAYSITLPASADNNPNVHIGFRWVNNDDGDATDPSFAVDDITLSTWITDTESPSLTCPGDMAAELGAGCSFVLPDYTTLVTVSDNLDPSPLLSQSPAPGATITGNTWVTVTATDESGNSAQCSFLVLPADSSAPEVQCPQNVTVTAASGDDFAFISLPLPVFNDNCGVVLINNDYTGSADASGSYPLGTTLVTYTVADASGNLSSCSFGITVNEIICCAEDLNCDGVINVSDLLIFMALFGTSGVDVTADFTQDGVVNVSDLLIFMSEFGSYCP